MQARSRKVEAQSKLEQLQRDIAELSSLSPDTVAAEEEVTQKLQQVRPMPTAQNSAQSRCLALQHQGTVFRHHTCATKAPPSSQASVVSANPPPKQPCQTTVQTLVNCLQEIDAAEAQHARLEMQADATKAERRCLEAALEEVQLSCAAGQADLAALRKDLTGLEQKVQVCHQTAQSTMHPSLADLQERSAQLLCADMAYMGTCKVKSDHCCLCHNGQLRCQQPVPATSVALDGATLLWLQEWRCSAILLHAVC